MIHFAGQILFFIVFSLLQVRVVPAKVYEMPAEEPSECIQNLEMPCSLSTGDRPRLVYWKNLRFEFDRHLVAKGQAEDKWTIFQGLSVVQADKPLTIQTPFAEILLDQSKVMIHVMNNKVRVLSLMGKGVIVRPKGVDEENYLVPGFQNWYGGVVGGESETGVVSVIDFDRYSKDRAPFFRDPNMSLIKEFKQVASIIKWAAGQAAAMHQELIQRKIASLESDKKEQIKLNKKQNQYNNYLRRLFLKKIRYDY